MKPHTLSTAKRWVMTALALCCSSAWSAYSCNVSVTSVGILYTQGTSQDTNGTVTITCSRDISDANSLTYRIKADDGLNYSGSVRQARVGAGSEYLDYILRRGTTVGGSASCGNASNWSAPTTGAQTIRSTLAFDTALTASDTWGYCVRTRGNQGSPTAGAYTDTVQVFAQYPNNNNGALSSSVALNYSVSVGDECVFNTFPANLAMSYTSFSGVDQTASQSFDIRCSNSLPWSLSVDAATSSLLGLNYELDLSPASGTGTGLDQSITLNGKVLANQAGTCANATCSATQSHTVTITY